MYVVAGVTGNTGSEVARTLLAGGKATRVIVRDAQKGEAWAALGAEVFVGSLDDAQALSRAFEGASGAYLLSPPDSRSNDLVGEAEARFRNIAQAVRGARLPHVVLLSSVGADLAQGTGPIVSLHHAERLLGAETTLTALRAGYFQENWAPMLPIAAKDGVLPSFVAADVAVPTVATADIGRLAAEQLLAGPRGQRVFDVLGPEEVTPRQVAEAASLALGRPVELAYQPLSAVVPTFVAFGMSEHMGRLYAEMYEWIGGGTGVGRAGAEILRGRIGIREGIARFAAATD